MRKLLANNYSFSIKLHICLDLPGKAVIAKEEEDVVLKGEIVSFFCSVGDLGNPEAKQFIWKR